MEWAHRFGVPSPCIPILRETARSYGIAAERVDGMDVLAMSKPDGTDGEARPCRRGTVFH